MCRDYQEIKIQDQVCSCIVFFGHLKFLSSSEHRAFVLCHAHGQVTELNVGSIPRSLLVILTDDLVDSVKAGDDVTLTGSSSWFGLGPPCHQLRKGQGMKKRGLGRCT